MKNIVKISVETGIEVSEQSEEVVICFRDPAFSLGQSSVSPIVEWSESFAVVMSSEP